MRFEKDELLLQKDQKPLELYFILKGEALNLQTGRTFGVGTIIGQDDILFWRKRTASFKALTIC